MRRLSVGMMWEWGKNGRPFKAFLLPTPPSLMFLHGRQDERTVSFEEACRTGTAAMLGHGLG